VISVLATCRHWAGGGQFSCARKRNLRLKGAKPFVSSEMRWRPWSRSTVQGPQPKCPHEVTAFWRAKGGIELGLRVQTCGPRQASRDPSLRLVRRIRTVDSTDSLFPVNLAWPPSVRYWRLRWTRLCTCTCTCAYGKALITYSHHRLLMSTQNSRCRSCMAGEREEATMWRCSEKGQRRPWPSLLWPVVPASGGLAWMEEYIVVTGKYRHDDGDCTHGHRGTYYRYNRLRHVKTSIIIIIAIKSITVQHHTPSRAARYLPASLLPLTFRHLAAEISRGDPISPSDQAASSRIRMELTGSPARRLQWDQPQNNMNLGLAFASLT
jgi:hypothetical protein